MTSTTILPADPTPEASGEGSPEVKSKPKRKKQTSLSSKRSIAKQDYDETDERKTKSQDVTTLLSTTTNPLSSTATNVPSTTTTTNPLSSAAANLTSATYVKDPMFLVMASGQIESAEVCSHVLQYQCGILHWTRCS